jgi:diguanylate cyclase (GGDEF)-like protein
MSVIFPLLSADRAENAITQEIDASLGAVQRDAAKMLYSHGVGSLVVSAFASSGLALIARHQLPAGPLAAWWFCMMLILLMRAVDILHFHKSRVKSQRPGAVEIRGFGIGVIAVAILWAIFPLAFLNHVDPSTRALIIIVFCGMAGGSTTVLAPSKGLAATFCAVILLPLSLLFFTLPGSANIFLGLMSCVYFAVMYASCRVTHNATMSAVQLSRANEVLLADMKVERHRTEAANLELKAAQGALQEANQSLEIRIHERTADLEKEMQEKERYARELAYLASTDPLTGLCNRATLTQRLNSLLSRAADSRDSLAVLFLDLDKFKEVNDVRGHLTGDRVLREVARRLVERLRSPVELARWGGDEFVVALPGLQSANSAVQVAEELSSRLREPIEVNSNLVRVDVTIGIALFPDHGRTEEGLIRAADMAMYAAKQEKKTRIRFFDPALSRRLRDRHLLECALRDAIRAGSLDVAFQPIIDSATGECHALEALARWYDSERGSVSPSDFISIAEQSGDIALLGRAILGKACRSATSWQTRNKSCAVSVNISAAELEAGTLFSNVENALKESGLPPSRLQLELTESVFAGDRGGIIPSLNRLRDIGVKILLDDFGTGFSCFADLQRLPIDQLKIDKSFIRSMESDNGAIVRAIMTTAQTFGLSVVAEGVETFAQAQRLKELGVQYLQGYFFSHCLIPDAVPKWLDEHASSVRHKRALAAAATGMNRYFEHRTQSDMYAARGDYSFRLGQDSPNSLLL